MNTADSFAAQHSDRSLFICATVSIMIHAAFVGGLSLLHHGENQEEEVPTVKVTLEAVSQKNQHVSPDQAAPPMQSTSRPSNPTPLASSAQAPIQNPAPITMKTSIKPLTTQIEEERLLIPQKNRVLKDHQAANALLGQNLMKMAEPRSNPHQSAQQAQTTLSPSPNIKNQSAIMTPLVQRTTSEPELSIMAKLPNRKILMTPTPGGKGISGSKVGLVNSIPPIYPRVAREAGWEGTVTIRVLVGPNGIPIETRVRKSSGHVVLDEAAIDAVKTWRFRPAKDGNIPIKSYVDIPVNFDLHNR